MALDPNAQAALRSLKDIAVPTPVSWMPQTWGWLLVAGVVTVIVALVFLAWLRRYKADAYRREALKLMEGIDALIQDPATRARGINQLAAVLKRTALAGWGRPSVASLSGDVWVRFLNDQDDMHVKQALESLLDDLEYHGKAGLTALPSETIKDISAAARHWIERHHVSA